MRTKKFLILMSLCMVLAFVFLYYQGDFYEKLKRKSLEYQTGIVQEYVSITSEAIEKEKQTTGNIGEGNYITQPLYLTEEMLSSEKIGLAIFMSTCGYDNKDELFAELSQNGISQVYKIDMKKIENFQYMNLIIYTSMFAVGEAQVKLYCQADAIDHQIVAYLIKPDKLDRVYIGEYQSEYSLAMQIYEPVWYMSDNFEYVATKIEDVRYQEEGITDFITSDTQLEFEVDLPDYVINTKQDVYIWLKAGNFDRECKGNLVINIEQEGDQQQESFKMKDLDNNQFFKIKLNKKIYDGKHMKFTITSDNEEADSSVCLYTMKSEMNDETIRYYITLE